VDAFTEEDVTYIRESIGEPIESIEPDFIKNKILNYIQKNINIKIPVKKELKVRDIRYLTQDTAQRIVEERNITMPQYISTTNTPTTKLMYDALNANQKETFNKLHEYLSSSMNIATFTIDYPKIILMDAAGGTGKSYLVECLSNSLLWPIVAIVKTRKLSLSFSKTDNLEVYTTCKYCMSLFGRNFTDTINLFNDIFPPEDMLCHIHNLINGVVEKTIRYKLLIVDEYSLESPVLLLLLCILSKKFKFNLLLLGDQKQQNTIQISKYHKGSNYTLLDAFPDIIKLKLKTQMRITDLEYLGKINTIRTIIENADKVNGDVLMNYHYKYTIFENFSELFIKKENILKAIYVTDTHLKSRIRIEALEKYAIAENIPVQRSYYTVLDLETNSSVVLALPQTYKFTPYILLVVGGIYLYKNSENGEVIVELREIKDNHIIVQNMITKGSYVVKKVLWTKYFHPCVDEQFTWLSNCTSNDIMQYPLKPAVLTFHSIQGLTFNHEEKLSFDLDAKTLNSIYVALSRISNKKQLEMIHTQEVLSLLYTMYKNDEFYYKVNLPTQNFVNQLATFYNNREYSFDDKNIISCTKFVKTIKEFERTKLQLTAISRSAYETQQKREKEEDSILLLLYQFYQQHYDVALRNIISDSEMLSLFGSFTKENLILQNIGTPNKRIRI